MNYKYYVHNDTVIATTVYNGKSYRATAKCHQDDIFDEEKGKKIATTKLNIKLTKVREKILIEEAYDLLIEREKLYDKYLKVSEAINKNYKHLEELEEVLTEIINNT